VPDGLDLHRLLKVVSFGAGSSSLDGEGRGALGIAAEELAANPAWHVLVVGHADNQGEKSGGENLGQSRARVTAEHLRALGVAQDHLSVQSLGSTYAQGDRYALEQVGRDRRVELWVFLP
jgi:outer membrane protein OmpA-like peptidoglycan-associated protein